MFLLKLLLFENHQILLNQEKDISKCGFSIFETFSNLTTLQFRKIFKKFVNFFKKNFQDFVDNNTLFVIIFLYETILLDCSKKIEMTKAKIPISTMEIFGFFDFAEV